MVMRIVLGLGLFVSVLAPAFATETAWTHKVTKISIDRIAGDMRLHDERDLSGDKKLDIILQFGNDAAGEPATLYLYRSTFPNPALWFERTTAAMQINMGGLGNDWTPSLFTLGGAPTPNGMRMIVSLPPGARFKTTGVAMAQVGEWMMKFRVTSRSLDREGVSMRLDRLIAAVHFANPAPAPHPLAVPSACENDGFDGGQIITDRLQEEAVPAALEGVVIQAAARGQTGLAAAPAEWCRAGSNLPPAMVSVYRRRQAPAEWVMLFGDAGLSMVGHNLELTASTGSKGKAKAALYVNRLDATHVVALYDGLPYADGAASFGLPVLMGQTSGLVSVSFGADDSSPKEKQ